MATQQQHDKYILRFKDEGMRKRLKVRAAMNERTLNAEITYLLKKGLEAEEQADRAPVATEGAAK